MKIRSLLLIASLAILPAAVQAAQMRVGVDTDTLGTPQTPGTLGTPQTRGVTAGAPTREERAALADEAHRCIAELRALLSRPETRQHFKKHYGLNPLRILERDDFALLIRAFVKRQGSVTLGTPQTAVTLGTPQTPSVQVGGYVFGETTLDLNVSVLRAARRAADPAPWRRYVAGVLVHELAHLADFLDDGVNDDGGLIDVEEGEAAQRASGCELMPPGELPAEADAAAGPLEVSQEFWSPRRK